MPKWLCVNPENFEGQIKMISENFNVIGFKDISTTTSIKNRLIITFDDGFRDNYDNAFKILNKYGVKATYFINPSTLAGQSLWIHKIYAAAFLGSIEDLVKKLGISGDLPTVKEVIEFLKRNCTYPEVEQKLGNLGNIKVPAIYFNKVQIIEMINGGMSFENHGTSHFPLTNGVDLNEEVAADDLLEKITGKKPEVFAYPFGNPESFDKRTNEFLLNKYSYICTTIPQINYSGTRVMGRVCSYEMKPEKLYLKLVLGY